MAFDASTWTDTRTAEEPAKRWRNWWQAKEPDLKAFCHCCGYEQKARLGEPFALPCGCDDWPTKEEAERNAALDAARIETKDIAAEYIGAYPEGERP